MVGQRLVDPLDDPVRRLDRQPPVDDDVQLGPDLVPQPSRPGLVDPDDPWHMERRMLDLGQDLGINPVEHPREDGPGRVPDDEEDRDRDGQADQGIEDRDAHRDPNRADQDSQRGETVDPGVLAVGDQRGRADLPADPDPEDGDRLVAEEADDRGGRHPPEVRDRLGVDEFAD